MNTLQRRPGAYRKILAAGLVCLFAAAGVQAANGANCELQLADSDVDYGHLNRTELEASSAPPHDVLLGKRRLTLNVSCTQPANMALRFNAAAAQDGGYAFAGKGGFTVKMSDAMLDGNPVGLAKTDASGRSIQAVAASQLVEAGRGVAAVANGALARGKHLVVGLEIDTRMPRSAMRVLGETRLEGRGQIELLAQ